jgi:hypothetical protein
MEEEGPAGFKQEKKDTSEDVKELAASLKRKSMEGQAFPRTLLLTRKGKSFGGEEKEKSAKLINC